MYVITETVSHGQDRLTVTARGETVAAALNTLTRTGRSYLTPASIHRDWLVDTLTRDGRAGLGWADYTLTAV